MTTDDFKNGAVPSLPGTFAPPTIPSPGCLRLNFHPVDGRGLSIAVHPQHRRPSANVEDQAKAAATTWLARVRNIGLLPLALDARLRARDLTDASDTPLLRQQDVTDLEERLRTRTVPLVDDETSALPDVLIRVDSDGHHVRIGGVNPRILAIRDELAAETLAWLSTHARWWDSLGAFAAKLEPV